MRTLSARGAKTRGRIIRAAADLFHKQGIHLTSPDQIIEASAIGKGQFYHYFKDKETLIHEVLQSHLQDIKAARAPFNFDVDSWDELEAWFCRHIEQQKTFNMTRACPIGTFGHDVTEANERLRQDINLILEVMKQKLVTFFVKEKAKGGLVPAADEEALAVLCIATIQGGMLVGKVARNSDLVDAAAKETMRCLARYRPPPGDPAPNT